MAGAVCKNFVGFPPGATYEGNFRALTAVPSIPNREPQHTGEDDRALLRAWSGNRDEAAFTAFVQRHLGMVQGAALRKTARPDLAEDVAQAVFALAARRAASLAGHPSAGAWLHRTAVFESANALRRELKQRKIAAAMLVHPDTSPESGLPDAVLPHLDDALDTLPEHDRRAVLLRYGERLSYEQMAARLGKSADACQKQTSRALERLRGLLTKHAALSLTVITAGLTHTLGTPATAAAAGKITAAAVGAAPHISLASLFQHLLHTMNTGKQIALAAGTVVLLTALPLGLQISEAASLRQQIASRSHSSSIPSLTETAAAKPAPQRETPGSRVLPGVNSAEADRILAMLRSLRGRMITSSQLVDVVEQLMKLPVSHMEEALKVLADFPGMMPAIPLRAVIYARFAELDPNAAMTAGASSGADKDMFTGDIVRYALAAGWMERDPQGLAAWLQEHPRDRGAGALASILGEKISLLDRETAAKLSAVTPAGGYPGQLLIEWERQAEDGDVKTRAKELIAQIKDSHKRGEVQTDYHYGELLSDVADILVEDDPRAALEFVLSPPGLEGGVVNQRALASVMDAWAKEDLAAAAAWAWTQTQNRSNEDGATHVWKALSDKNEDEILAFLAKAPDEAARLYSLQRTALESAENPEKALHLMAGLPDEPRREALQKFGQIRAGESLMKTSEWLLTLSDGPDKDAAIRGFAPVLAKEEAASAMIWASSITDPNARTQLLGTLGQAWLQKAPDTARQWLNSSDKLTDADRAAIAAAPRPKAAETDPDVDGVYEEVIPLISPKP